MKRHFFGCVCMRLTFGIQFSYAMCLYQRSIHIFPFHFHVYSWILIVYTIATGSKTVVQSTILLTTNRAISLHFQGPEVWTVFPFKCCEQHVKVYFKIWCPKIQWFRSAYIYIIIYIYIKFYIYMNHVCLGGWWGSFIWVDAPIWRDWRANMQFAQDSS